MEQWHWRSPGLELDKEVLVFTHNLSSLQTLPFLGLDFVKIFVSGSESEQGAPPLSFPPFPFPSLWNGSPGYKPQGHILVWEIFVGALARSERENQCFGTLGFLSIN